MRLGIMVATILLFASLSGCCAPDRCYVVQSRFEVLEPVTNRLKSFEAENGRLPANLEEAFPEGLPKGIKALEGRKGDYGVAKDDGNSLTFSYGRNAWPGADADEFAIHFSYVGGGLLAGMNDCVWTESQRTWACYGHI